MFSAQLANNQKFELAPLAFLLLAKLNFHLGNFDESVGFALQAGDTFNIEDNTQFTETILAVILDKYTEARVQNRSQVTSALEAIFTRVVNRCLRDREFKQLIGMSLDCRRLDILEAVIRSAQNPEEATSLLYYAKKASANLNNCVEFRGQVLNCIIELFMALPKLDYVFICDCLITTGQPEKVAQAICHLASNEAGVPEAIQIAFNVQADATQDFLAVVSAGISGISDSAVAESIRNILSGKVTSRLYMEFLCRANKTDPLILEKTKSTLNPQMSLHHQALSCANGFSQAGTTNDEFLRKNLDFLSHASNWAKFSATVSLGSIHRGQLERSRDLLSAYLPRPGVSGSVYSEGGALMALGMIHANHGDDILPFLLEQLASSQSEVVQHGACLGLGVSGMASKNDAVLEVIKGILYADNAIAGESAGVSIGLLMLGSGDEGLVAELKQYAHESQHEKIIRSLSLGMALIMYGRQDQADTLIAELEAEKDPILRYGAVWTVALAYAGTSSNAAVNKLLHFAVSDASDDVRRAAVTALGFVLFRNPEELPRLVELLTESYNPSVRYGSAMALGIAFAGTANQRAIDLIMPMCKDITDFVRQAAFISLAMILMQQNDQSAGDQQVTNLRKQLEQVISTRHEDQLVKFGAILAQGILDAGGRNVRLALNTPSGHVSLPGVTGLALFCQFWYWYPFAHFLSLSFCPTALVAVTSTVPLKLPKLSAISNAPPALFAYPEATKPTVTAAPKKIVTAVLSTTAKAAARARKVTGLTTSMSIDPEDDKAEADGKSEINEDNKGTGSSAETASADILKSATNSVNFEMIDNLSRVVSAQLPLIQFPMDSRFQPVAPLANWKGGVIVLKDTAAGEGDFEFIKFEGSSDEATRDNEATEVNGTSSNNSNTNANHSSVKSPRLSPEHTSPSNSSNMMED